MSITVVPISQPYPLSLVPATLSCTADAILVTSTVLSPVWWSLALPGTPCSGSCRNKKHAGVVCELLSFREGADWSGSGGIFLINQLRKVAVVSDVK